MSSEDWPDEYSERDDGLDGIAGIEGIDAHLDGVAGRDILPWWFDGVTVSSGPGMLMVGLMNEHDEVRRTYETDPEGARKLGHVNMKLNLFSELHVQHRAMVARGITPLVAVACVLDTICKTIERGNPPFNGYEPVEWEPYVWKVANSYRDLYSAIRI